jgi:hypothetical protein
MTTTDTTDARRRRMLAAVGDLTIVVYDEQDDNGRLGPPGRPMTRSEYLAPILATLEQLERGRELVNKVANAR